MKSARHLDRLEIFTLVVQKGSFTAAADERGITRSMVSQHISRLEEELGAKLLQRTTRKLALTEAGKIFYEGCLKIIEEADRVITQIQRLQNKPSGLLRIAAGEAFGEVFLIPIMSEFMRQFPQIQVDLMFSDHVVDLIDKDVDLAIRVGELKDSSMVATVLGKTRHVFVPLLRYLNQHQIPVSPRDLLHHVWINHSVFPVPRPIKFYSPSGKEELLYLEGPISVSTGKGVLQFVLEGAGVAIMPDFFLKDHLQRGELVTVLTEYRVAEKTIYAMFPSAKQLPPKVRAFLDFFQTIVRVANEECVLN